MKFTLNSILLSMLLATGTTSFAQNQIPAVTMPTGKEIKKLPYILYNEPILQELFQIKGTVRSVNLKVTEFQTPGAVSTAGGKEIYTVKLSVDPLKRIITEVSTKNKPSGYLVKNIYTYDKKLKPVSLKYYEDELKGAGWELKDEKVYTYTQNNEGNYINRQVSYLDVRPGNTNNSYKPEDTFGFYDSNYKLLGEINGTLKISYQYNKQGDIIEKKIDAGENARGIYKFKYEYDTRGNWIKKEEYDSNDVKDNVLMSITTRTIVY